MSSLFHIVLLPVWMLCVYIVYLSGHSMVSHYRHFIQSLVVISDPLIWLDEWYSESANIHHTVTTLGRVCVSHSPHLCSLHTGNIPIPAVVHYIETFTTLTKCCQSVCVLPWQWLSVTVYDYTRLPKITCDYPKLTVIAWDLPIITEINYKYLRLPVITWGYLWLPVIVCDHLRLTVITWDYLWLPKIAWD